MAFYNRIYISRKSQRDQKGRLFSLQTIWENINSIRCQVYAFTIISFPLSFQVTNEVPSSRVARAANPFLAMDHATSTPVPCMNGIIGTFQLRKNGEGKG